jgi:hypothetical protein
MKRGLAKRQKAKRLDPRGLPRTALHRRGRSAMSCALREPRLPRRARPIQQEAGGYSPRGGASSPVTPGRPAARHGIAGSPPDQIPWRSGRQIVRPSSRTMQNAQNLDNVVQDAVGRDIGRAVDDQLPGSLNATDTAASGKSISSATCVAIISSTTTAARGLSASI